ncbi:MAG TPA: AAC(3) family N-acetyltransferase [Pyrinomonadaceae bacterium]|jgi:aminoglycoside 3-N-acetyltransferase|nr:AAC(3) family N-acetyltransferase [Pyrinomonadaceae bacterium]
MSVARIARKILPAGVTTPLVRAVKRLRRARVARLPLLSEEDFTRVLADELGLSTGDTVYVHSAVDQLNLGFPFYRILPLVRRVVGERGTVLFPTYPNRGSVSSYEYLLAGNVFDVRRTPSYTGLLTEFARRQRDAVRSLHPTKSVCALGRLARELTGEHHLSPYPYDSSSPYYKLVGCGAKIVGLGVWTQYLSFAYVIDDALKRDAPVETYYPHAFAARCVNYEGDEVTVETYAHDMRKVVHDIPRYVREHVPADVCRDLTVGGMKFFRADAAPLFEVMLRLAKQGVTVYPRRLYSKKFIDPAHD